MRRRTCAIITVAGTLAACATASPPAPAPALLPPPAVIVALASEALAVKPPLRTSCLPRNFPRAPRYPDTDQALKNAGGAADRYQLLAAGRLIRSRRLAELERALEGCR